MVEKRKKSSRNINRLFVDEESSGQNHWNRSADNCIEASKWLSASPDTNYISSLKKIDAPWAAVDRTVRFPHLLKWLSIYDRGLFYLLFSCLSFCWQLQLSRSYKVQPSLCRSDQKWDIEFFFIFRLLSILKTVNVQCWLSPISFSNYSHTSAHFSYFQFTLPKKIIFSNFLSNH